MGLDNGRGCPQTRTSLLAAILTLSAKAHAESGNRSQKDARYSNPQRYPNGNLGAGPSSTKGSKRGDLCWRTNQEVQ